MKNSDDKIRDYEWVDMNQDMLDECTVDIDEEFQYYYDKDSILVAKVRY